MIRAATHTLIACFGLSALAHAQGAQLNVPEFTQLRTSATQSVDISLGKLALQLAGMIGDGAGTPDDDASVIKSLQALDVRHYEFASDFAYPKEKIDSVRTQLGAAGWSPLVHVRDVKKSQDVDISLAMDKDCITGVAIVVSEPREFTIIHAVGNLRIDQVNALRRQIESHTSGDKTWHSGWAL